MFDKLNLLGIGVVGMNDNPPPEPPVDDAGKTFWVIILLAIIVICLLLSKYLPDVADSLKNGKKNKEQKKIEQARDEELERLHKIKERNKRK